MDFGELRSLLNQPPSELGWRRVCWFLERAWTTHRPEATRSWLPYAESHLESWPDALRRCPTRWARHLIVEPDFEPGRLVRQLRVMGLRGDQARLGRLLESPCWPGLTALEAPRQRLDDGALGRLLERAPPGLVRLDLSENELTCDGVEALLSSPVGPQLRALDLSNTRVGISLSLASLRHHAPPLEALALRDCAAPPDELARLPEALPALARLEVHGNGLHNHLCLLCERAPCDQLRHLGLGDNDLSQRDLRALGRSELLGQLRSLDLSDNALWLVDVRELFEGPHFGQLESLDLHLNHLQEGDLRELLPQARLRRLRRLNLAVNWLGPASARALARAEGLERLEALDLSSNNLGALGAQELARAPRVPGLVELGLGYNELGPEGARALARGELAAQLRRLRLPHNKLRDQGVAELFGIRSRLRLQILELGTNQLTTQAAQWIATSEAARSLRELDLGFNIQLGAAGARHLARSPNLRGLTRLDLDDAAIEIAGMRHLARSPHLDPLIRARWAAWASA